MSGPDRRRGRGGGVSPTPVKAVALARGIPVEEDVREVLGRGAELGIVVAYGRLVPSDVLAALSMVNLHFSLLPRWRGAAPVERAILAGDLETGVCLMALDAGLDTGPIYACARTAIRPGERAEELAARLAEMGTALLLERLEAGPAGLGTPRPQEGTPSYAAKITPAELRLDWRRPAVELERVVRAGRAWTSFRGSRLVIHRARVATGPPPGAPGPEAPPGSLWGTFVATGDGLLELLEVRPAGRRLLEARDWLRGVRAAPGELLGEDARAR